MKTKTFSKGKRFEVNKRENWFFRPSQRKLAYEIKQVLLEHKSVTPTQLYKQIYSNVKCWHNEQYYRMMFIISILWKMNLVGMRYNNRFAVIWWKKKKKSV